MILRLSSFTFVHVSLLWSVGVVSTVVPDSAHKLFIGGLPNYLNDDQVSTSPCTDTQNIEFYFFLFKIFNIFLSLKKIKTCNTKP